MTVAPLVSELRWIKDQNCRENCKNCTNFKNSRKTPMVQELDFLRDYLVNFYKVILSEEGIEQAFHQYQIQPYYFPNF